MALAFVAGACVTLADIQQAAPMRTLKFTGSHQAVAQCIQRRLGGKLHDDSFAQRYVIYDSVKGQQREGLTHYSITVGSAGADQGFAEWRVVTPPQRRDPASQRQRIPPLTDAIVQQYWGPVEDCAAQARIGSAAAPKGDQQ